MRVFFTLQRLDDWFAIERKLSAAKYIYIYIPQDGPMVWFLFGIKHKEQNVGPF